MLVSEITQFLEEAYEVLNQKFFESELSKVVITVQSSPKTHGHYTLYEAWQEDQQGYREINISAETLNHPISNVIATLVHEMTHHYCHLKEIKDTSRGGAYHNKRFKQEAEKRGLVLDYHGSEGFSITHPGPMLMDLIYLQGWKNMSLARIGGRSSYSSNGGNGSDDNSPSSDGNLATGKKKSSTRKYICPTCGCSVRATKVVNIGCLDCKFPMVVEEK